MKWHTYEVIYVGGVHLIHYATCKQVTTVRLLLWRRWLVMGRVSRLQRRLQRGSCAHVDRYRTAWTNWMLMERETLEKVTLVQKLLSCVEIITGLPCAWIEDSISQHCQKPMVSMVTVRQISQVGLIGKCYLFIHGWNTSWALSVRLIKVSDLEIQQFFFSLRFII